MLSAEFRGTRYYVAWSVARTGRLNSLSARTIHLLVTTDDSLEKIATALGYSDASNFSKAFNKWAGLSSGAYRASFAQSPPGSLG